MLLAAGLLGLFACRTRHNRNAYPGSPREQLPASRLMVTPLPSVGMSPRVSVNVLRTPQAR
jgi:hypothetical protein